MNKNFKDMTSDEMLDYIETLEKELGIDYSDGHAEVDDYELTTDESYIEYLYELREQQILKEEGEESDIDYIV